MNLEIDNDLDTSGLLCPEPVMMLHQTVRDMSVGQILKVTATDPSTVRDIPKFCLYLGHELLLKEEVRGEFIYIIRLGSPTSKA